MPLEVGHDVYPICVDSSLGLCIPVSSLVTGSSVGDGTYCSVAELESEGATSIITQSSCS